jgi:hypothetical protein
MDGHGNGPPQTTIKPTIRKQLKTTKMKTTFKTLICAAICCAASFAFAAPPTSSSQTAQSIMVNMTPNSGAFVIGGSTTWSYTHPVRSCAADHYTTVVTGPDVTCSPYPSGGCTSAPTPPPAPGDSNGHLNQFLNSQTAKCAFFCGGILPSDTNDRSVNVNNSHDPNKGHWTFTWHYALTPTGPVDPQTCYTCEETGGGGSINIAFCGFVAGESFLSKSGGTDKWNKKYSFTLTNDDGSSRVTNVQATLQRSTDGGMTWFDVQGPFAVDTSFIQHCGRQTDSIGGSFCDGLGLVVDYIYDANAGVGGNSPSIFNNLHSSGVGMPIGTYLAPDYTDNIMSGAPPSPDNFAGNDHNLCNYSDTAPFNVEFDGITDAGDYQVHITGTVKGNSATADQQFTVSSGGGGTVTVNGCNDPMCPIPESCPQ